MNSKSFSVAFPKMKWTLEMETTLISLIEKKPHLWDPRNENYLKKNLMHYSYKEIGDALKERWPEYSLLFTHEDLVHKFANLRSYYRRELKKFKQICNAEDENFVPKWDHFVHLSFLKNALIRDNGESSLDSKALIRDNGESSLDSTSQVLYEVSMPSEDDETDSRDSSRDASTPTLDQVKARINGKEPYPRKRTKRSSSTDESSNDASSSSTPKLRKSGNDVTQGRKESQSIAASDSADSAFCHYLYTMLLTVPDGFDKEVAKKNIMETILKLKYPDRGLQI